MHASRSLTKRVIGSAAAVGLLGGLITVAATTSQVVSAAPTVIASDLTGGAPVNLTSYTNPWTGAFASAADGFEIYQRVVSASIPFSVLDDTLATFPPDTQGIVDDNNLDRFFGAVDT